MKYQQFSELFLELILTSYFDKNNGSLRTVINFDIIGPAVKNFITHFHSYDLAHKTTHILLIEKMFITKELKSETCEKLGYCKRTFYRYRNQYLQTFELYLLREIEIFEMFSR